MKDPFGVKPNQVDPKKVEQFVKGSAVAATKPAKAKPKQQGGYPWQEATVREDMKKDVLVTLTEPTKLKLEWLAANGHIKSQRAFNIETLTNAIDSLVKKNT